MPIYNEKYNELIYGRDEIIKFSDLLPTLKILILPACFNEAIRIYSLPESLEILIFGSNFNQKIGQNVLPTNLKVLVFGDCFTQQIEKNTIPLNLKILKFGFRYKENIKKNILPDTLEMLYVDNYINIEKYPTGLKKFVFKDRCYNSWKKPVFDLQVLPENIEFLDFLFWFGDLLNYDLNKLNKLKILKIGHEHLNCIKKLPQNLVYLEIYGTDSDDDILDLVNYNILPPNLEYLVLTSFLTFSNIKNCDNGTLIQNSLQKLKYLSIDGHKKQLNILNNLPIDLSIIKFTDLKTEINNLPINLKEIQLTNNSNVKYLKKIPFDCNVINYQSNIEIIENYLVNTKYSIPTCSNLISNNILILDNIRMQYYSICY